MLKSIILVNNFEFFMKYYKFSLILDEKEYERQKGYVPETDEPQYDKYEELEMLNRR
jgi:hypothetical protein